MLQAQDFLAYAYDEAASSAKQHPLSVAWAQYQKLSDVGLLHICGCFDGDILVGFVCIVKSLDFWRVGSFVADVTAVYLRPEYRKGLNGYRLIRQAEKLAIVIDCKEIRFSVSRRSKGHSGKPRANLFATIGYQFREAVFTKRL
jgi:GNAT superfamily N-acetyltransferase